MKFKEKVMDINTLKDKIQHFPSKMQQYSKYNYKTFPQQPESTETSVFFEDYPNNLYGIIYQYLFKGKRLCNFV